MRKVLYICILFLTFQNVVIFGQDNLNNSLAIGASFSVVMPIGIGPGINIEYERLINENISFTIEAGIDMILFPYIEINGRWFPWSNSFFIGVGTGFWSIFPFENEISLFTISTNIGWRFNINKRIVLIPHLCTRFIFMDSIENISKIGLKIGYKF